MTYWLVRDVMRTDVVTVSPDTAYATVVDTVVDRAVSGLPVVDRDNRVLGVVTEADLLRRRTATTAGELMRAPAIVVTPDTSVAAAARLMLGNRVRRLPVVDQDGRLVGLVARRDMLRLHTRSESSIGDDVVDDVVRAALGLDPSSVQVTVAQGVVTLAGAVGRRSVAVRAVELTVDVAGVVEVVDQLTWEVDDLDGAPISEPEDAESRGS